MCNSKKKYEDRLAHAIGNNNVMAYTKNTMPPTLSYPSSVSSVSSSLIADVGKYTTQPKMYFEEIPSIQAFAKNWIKNSM